MLDPNIIDPDSCECIDFESALIRRGLPAPVPVVCGFYFRGEEPKLLGLFELFWELLRLLRDKRRCIVGHNISYDFCLALEWCWILGPELAAEFIRLVFEAYDDDRIYDTMPAQRLVEIETGDKRGRLSLDKLGARYGMLIEKHLEDEEDTGIGQKSIRLDFGRFVGCKASDLPPRHYQYAIGDSIQTHELFRRIISRGLVKRKDLAELCRNDLALKLTSAYGMMTDAERVVKLEAQARAQLVRLQAIMFEHGFMRWERRNPKPVKTMAAIKLAVAKAYELEVDEKGMYCGPMVWLEELQEQGLITEAGAMSTSKLVLSESGDPLLISLQDFNEWAAVWNKDLKLFRTSVDVPFHSRFGFAATLRTTSGDPNIQNFRKKEGIRECIIARNGALVASDYTGLENSTLAAVIYKMLGRRGMVDKINGGHNFHCEVACHILGLEPTVENMLHVFEQKEKGIEPFKSAYNAAKPLNFGLPGFMTKATTVQSYARIGYGVNRTVEFWQDMIDLWHGTQYDQVAYLHDYVDGLRGEGGLYTVPIPGSGVVRRGATRTAAANTGFQGLGGRIALKGLYLTVRAQMLRLLPGKVCAFIHDEEISDCRPDQADEVAAGQEYWMKKAGETLAPEINWQVASVAMAHWSKKAKSIKDSDGRLLVDHSH